MTRLDEPVRPADRRAAALLAVKGHEHRRCINCPPEGPCGVEWWALAELAQHPGPHRLLADPHPTDPTPPGNPR